MNLKKRKVALTDLDLESLSLESPTETYIPLKDGSGNVMAYWEDNDLHMILTDAAYHDQPEWSWNEPDPAPWEEFASDVQMLEEEMRKLRKFLEEV